ncbi:MAG: glycoside hydrolase family 3 C-terminal domain-containing protein, partial [Firmicutes bacterium]|nr:glycoside hydrolase family 3 C-terminal domain-containing protein [Bacillota bacterium]
SKELLCDILRGKFGFKGYVVSDCGAVADIYFGHKKVNSISEAAAEAINNGCDLCLGEDYKQLPEAYEKGLVDEKTITEAAVKLMEARLRLGMQDKTDFDDLTYEDVVDCPAHRELNLRMARESIVLLKNNGILPLDRSKKIAVVGPAADSRAVLLANYNGLPYDYTTFLTGIRNAATGRVYYEKGCQFYYGENECPEEALPEDAAVIASRADVVIMIMGLSPSMEGEEMASGWKGCDRGDKVDLELPEGQKELLNFMAASGKPVIFVNVSGSAVSLTEADEKCDAVIQCFYPGARGGEALADVIFGNVSPSGKLPVTFYKSASDLPPFEDYSMKGRTYRYFEGTPLYPFAHGLSYTHFKYSDIFYDSDGIHCSITNDGGREAFETVLVFSENKYTELADFKKVFIKPGETVDILFETNDSYNDIFVGHCLPKYAGEGDGAHLKIRR